MHLVGFGFSTSFSSAFMCMEKVIYECIFATGSCKITSPFILLLLPKTHQLPLKQMDKVRWAAC